MQHENVDRYDYYTSYIKTYLERDVRQLLNLKDERKFYNFMIACAARTGQLLNTTDIANTVDVDVKTVQGWISVLQTSGIIYMMQPFWANATKRLAKTPELYFRDTGLADYEVGFGQVICQTPEPYLLSGEVQAVPVWAIIRGSRIK